MKRSKILLFYFFETSIVYGLILSFFSYFGEGKISEKSFLSFGKLIVLNSTDELDFFKFLEVLVFELYFENS